jgi:hypothetical protein
MVFSPLGSANAYIAFAEQTSGLGVVATPSYFPRWLNGSGFEMDLKTEEIREGGTRRASQHIKNGQSVKIKLMCLPRPNELALFEAMAAGSSSDTYTGPTVSTTTSGSSNTAGSTTLVLVDNTGLTASGTVYVVAEPGTSKEEVVALTTPGSGSSTPYTYTIANSGTLKYTHSASSTVKSSAKHVITDQLDGQYYTFEISLGGTSGLILRVRDCKLETIKRSSSAGKSLQYDLELIGCVSLVQSSALTVTLEAHNQFLYTQGVFTIDGSATGDALEVSKFDISGKNNLDAIQAEKLVFDGIIFGKVDMDVNVDLIFQTSARIQNTFFGSATGTTDAQAMYTGSLSLVFTQADNFNTVTYSLPTLAYTKVGLPQPKDDNKAFTHAYTATANSAQGANTYLIQTTVTDTLYAAAV